MALIFKLESLGSAGKRNKNAGKKFSLKEIDCKVLAAVNLKKIQGF